MVGAMSAFGEIMTGDLPPSSRVTGTRFSEAARITCLATDVAPVKSKWSKASPEKSAPVCGPPVMTAISSSSNSSAKPAAMAAEVAGVYSLGLIMQRLPADSTPAKGVNVRFTGKFQGLITPTTPSGWYSTHALAPNKAKIPGVTLRLSFFCQRLRFCCAWRSGPTEEATSVNSDWCSLR